MFRKCQKPSCDWRGRRASSAEAGEAGRSQASAGSREWGMKALSMSCGRHHSFLSRSETQPSLHCAMPTLAAVWIMIKRRKEGQGETSQEGRGGVLVARTGSTVKRRQGLFRRRNPQSISHIATICENPIRSHETLTYTSSKPSQ